jgi:hypothetical protein
MEPGACGFRGGTAAASHYSRFRLRRCGNGNRISVRRQGRMPGTSIRSPELERRRWMEGDGSSESASICGGGSGGGTQLPMTEWAGEGGGERQ